METFLVFLLACLNAALLYGLVRARKRGRALRDDRGPIPPDAGAEAARWEAEGEREKSRLCVRCSQWTFLRVGSETFWCSTCGAPVFRDTARSAAKGFGDPLRDRGGADGLRGLRALSRGVGATDPSYGSDAGEVSAQLGALLIGVTLRRLRSLPRGSEVPGLPGFQTGEGAGGECYEASFRVIR